MAVKDVTNALVCKAVSQWWLNRQGPWPYHLLIEWTGEPEPVCKRAMERAIEDGLIVRGASLRTSRLTHKGKRVLARA